MSVTLKDVGSGFKRTAINENFTDIESEINNNLLNKDGSTALESDLDFNSNRAINLADGVFGTDGVNVNQLNAIVSGAGGLSSIAQARETQLGSQAVANVFTLSGITYAVGTNTLSVYRNGQRLEKTIDYTETTASSVTLTFTPNGTDRFVFITNDLSTSEVTTTAAITHTESGTDYALDTYLQNRYVVNVKDFGAVGDGAVDDTAALQAAFDAGISVFLPAGTYLISAPLTKDATGFKLLGESEGAVTIKADAGFVGSYMVNLGNGSVSRYFNDVRYVSFNGNNVASLVGLYLNRVNNQSKIMHNQFQNCATAIKAENLSLSNVCAYNKFGDGGNTIDIHLVGTAGNSWLIMGNYFTAGGYIYMDNSMTDVKIVQNVGDGDSYILGDGASGQRGCQIVGNRYENTSNTAVQLGLVRGMTIHDNYFTGSGSTARAIDIASSSSDQSCSIASNQFESFTTEYIRASNTPGNKISLFDNTDDSSATMFTGNRTATKIHEQIITENDVLTIGASEVRYEGGTAPVFSKFINKTGVITGSAQSFATITVPATSEGAYTIAFEGLIGFAANSTATASIGFKKCVSVTHGNTGTPAFGTVSDIYLTDSAATASGTRDVSTVVLSAVNTSDTVATLQIDVGVTGSGNVDLIGEIKVYWEGYPTLPIVAQV